MKQIKAATENLYKISTFYLSVLKIEKEKVMNYKDVSMS